RSWWRDGDGLMFLRCFLGDTRLILTCVCVQSRDRDHRKSAGKAGLDSSGNLYQYDNYDEVAMDTDSETGSPGEQTADPSDWPSFPVSFLMVSVLSVSSPTPHLLSAEEPGGVPQVSLCDTNTASAFGMVRSPPVPHPSPLRTVIRLLLR
uniref:Uncharacterized protein n=1 Tax=Amphiprion percula TaxID=161767 RepID=A0A3P8SVL6_AMPPE